MSRIGVTVYTNAWLASSRIGRLMRALKKIGVTLGIAFFPLCAASLHAATYEIDWYLGHPNLDYFEEAAAEFKSAVEKKSNGEIKIRIVKADADAWGPPEIATKVEKGEIEMGHSYADVMGHTDARLMAFDAPYLFRGYRHMEGVIEGPVGNELLEGLHAKNILGLCYTYSGGASGVATINREIRRPEDLKGLRVGVYGNAVNEAWIKALGAVPVRINHELKNLRQMARDNALDAVAITWRNFEEAELDEEFQYFNLPSVTYLVSLTYVNKEFFLSLPPAFQTLIREESLKSARLERARTIQLNEQAKRAMLSRGVRPVFLTKAGSQAFAASLRPAYEQSINGIIGKDHIERIKKTKDADVHPLIPEHVAASR